jgi:hypothetical protein
VEIVGYDWTFGDPENLIVRYDWTFGDGGSADDAGPTPSYAYSTADDYRVTLTVTDNDGQTDTDNNKGVNGSNPGGGHRPTIARGTHHGYGYHGYRRPGVGSGRLVYQPDVD